VGALESASSHLRKAKVAGGSFSPRAMVRVGGGGKRPEPRVLRSVGVLLMGKEADGWRYTGMDSG
jgi:hypothetical protein